MKKTLLLKSTRTNFEPTDQENWTQFTIHPVANAVRFLTNFAKEYSEGKPKSKSVECIVVGVKGQETACVTICGRRRYVLDFIQQAVLYEKFSEYWSWCETTMPEIYL